MLNVIMLNVIMLSVIILNAIMLSVVAPFGLSWLKPGNSYRGGRLSTVDLLFKLACFVKNPQKCIKISRSELVRIRRLNVPILSRHSGFPA